MLVLSLIHIYNVKAAVYKVLQTFSQRITWVFCSTMVYAKKVHPLNVNSIGQNMGKRSTVIHCLTDCDTTNVPMCYYHRKVVPIILIENPSPTSSSTF